MYCLKAAVKIVKKNKMCLKPNENNVCPENQECNKIYRDKSCLCKPVKNAVDIKNSVKNYPLTLMYKNSLCFDNDFYLHSLNMQEMHGDGDFCSIKNDCRVHVANFKEAFTQTEIAKSNIYYCIVRRISGIKQKLINIFSFSINDQNVYT